MKRILSRIPLTAIALLFSALVLAGAVGALSSCKTSPTKPDSFVDAVVTCTQENAYSSQAGAAVLACLTDAVGGDYSTCLANIVTLGHFTVDEVACLVRQYVTTSAARINGEKAGAADATVVQRGNAWLKAHNITFVPGGGK